MAVAWVKRKLKLGIKTPPLPQIGIFYRHYITNVILFEWFILFSLNNLLIVVANERSLTSKINICAVLFLAIL